MKKWIGQKHTWEVTVKQVLLKPVISRWGNKYNASVLWWMRSHLVDHLHPSFFPIHSFSKPAHPLQGRGGLELIPAHTQQEAGDTLDRSQVWSTDVECQIVLQHGFQTLTDLECVLGDTRQAVVHGASSPRVDHYLSYFICLAQLRRSVWFHNAHQSWNTHTGHVVNITHLISDKEKIK